VVGDMRSGHADLPLDKKSTRFKVKSLSLSSSLIISRKMVLGIAPLMLFSCRATREQANVRDNGATEACVQYADHREPPLHISCLRVVRARHATIHLGEKRFVPLQV
jgi:hypothetical protein